MPDRTRTRVAIVPHTHWDREWYSPFQTFRLRLVKLLDVLLPLLESDLSYARFLLDGQTAVIDDYLEVRPEAEATLQRLAAAGRLSIGPWMVLMDEFMVSGETMVRDLQFGIARGSQLGGVMEVGYLPDMFGHVAQMPQMLRLGGFEHAVVWRGVPASVEQTAFWWEAPDGSRVRAEYLYGSYSNGRDLPDDAKQLVTRAVDYEKELGPVRIQDMLLMNGTDHQMPQPWLGRVVAEANAIQDDYEFVVTTLPEYVVTQPSPNLTTVHGELRSGARANLLMGVGSNRVDVHRACAAAERALEKRAEPLSALLLPPAAYPHKLAELAWRELILNSAHDSSCACSHDEVVDQVVVRYAEARQIAEGLGPRCDARARGRCRRARRVDRCREPYGADSVRSRRRNRARHRARARSWASTVSPAPRSCSKSSAAKSRRSLVQGQKVLWVLDMMRGTEFGGRPITSYDVTDGRRRSRDRAARGPARRRPVRPLGATRPDARARRPRRHRPPPGRRARRYGALVFDAGTIDGFSWTCFTARDGASPDGLGARRRRSGDRQRARAGRRLRPTARIRSSPPGAAHRWVRPPRRRRRRRRHVQLLAAGRRRRDRHARFGRRCRGRVRSGARPHPDRRGVLLAHARGRATSAPARNAPTSRLRAPCAPRSSCARANGSCASRTTSTTTRATIACACTYRSPPR